MVPPHLLKVTQACLATVRTLWAMLNHFQRKAAGLSSCALHECEHRPARQLEQKYRLNRFLLLSLLGKGSDRPISSVSRLLQPAHALPSAPADALIGDLIVRRDVNSISGVHPAY